jgi:hemoglobin/transferrin/lactoferrin receptor protein
MATLTIGMRAMDGKLTLGLRGTAASEGYAGVSQPVTEGYALLDFFSSYKLTSNVELGLKVDNVFDLAYSPYTTTPLTSSDPLNPNTMEQGRGRTVLLTAKSQF